jgi:N-acetylmuramoyl-L-alanine amidase
VTEALRVPEDHLFVMARTIYGEARGETFDGQVAVAWVIRNRSTRPSRFGVGIKGVCLKPAQFSCWFDSQKTLIEDADFRMPGFARAFGIACLVTSGDIPSPVGEADHYFTVTAPRKDMRWPPVWAGAMDHIATVGAHTFYQERA